MFPDSYKDFDLTGVDDPMHRMILQALLQTELRPCDIRDRLGLKDSAVIYRVGWKHLGRNFFNERTDHFNRKAKASVLNGLAEKAAAAKAAPGASPDAGCDADPVLFVPAPEAVLATDARCAAGDARPPRAAPMPDAAGCGGLSIGDVVLRGRHTPWFEEHVPRRRRADLRSRMPWLGTCRLREPAHPLQLVGVELFLFTDLKTLEIKELCPALQGGFSEPLAQCLCTTDPSRFIKRRCGAIERLRECGAKGPGAPALPVDAAAGGHPAVRMERTPAMPQMPQMPQMPRTPAMPAAHAAGFRLRFRRGGTEVEYEGAALGAAEIEAFMRLALGGAA